MTDSSVDTSQHMCGLQGFNPYYDICPAHEKQSLMQEEGYSEEQAERITVLKFLSGGEPFLTNPIRDHYSEELREYLNNLKGIEQTEQ